MTALQAQRIIDAFGRGQCDEVMRTEGVSFTTSRYYVCLARRVLGINGGRQARRGIKYELGPFDYELVARLWSEGKTNQEIDTITGRSGSVNRARRKLGVERVPSHAVPTVDKPVGLLRMADLDRRFMRKIGDEFIFRDSAMREEVWKKDDAGFSGPFRNRYRFSHVLGMTEKKEASK